MAFWFMAQSLTKIDKVTPQVEKIKRNNWTHT